MNEKEMCEKLLDIIEKMETGIHARVAFDIADVIEANELKNPDNIVFDREVARSVMIQEKANVHKMMHELRIELKGK